MHIRVINFNNIIKIKILLQILEGLSRVIHRHSSKKKKNLTRGFSVQVWLTDVQIFHFGQPRLWLWTPKWVSPSLNPILLLLETPPPEAERERLEMAMQWGVTVWMAKMVWIALKGWVTSCFLVADELATAFRNAPRSLPPSLSHLDRS